jgi:hypothetical protein
MNIQELKTLLQNKLRNLNDKKNAAFANGDIVLYESYIKEIEDVEEIIKKIQE